MTLLHFRYRRRLGLLASSALEAREADEVRRHAATCASCQTELADLTRTVTALQADAALDRPLPVSSEALRTRVLARIRGGSLPGTARVSWNLGAAAIAMGLVGVGLLAGVLAARLKTTLPEPSAMAARLESQREATFSETTLNDTAFYERLEKTRLRASAARYLAEAQDVLVQVAAAADCPDSPKDSVDVGREARTSRSLLSRRAALVSGSEGALISAQGVMEEVEGLLQQVADLPHCTRRRDVDAIARSVDEKHLLMKMDLVAQELGAL